LAGGDLWRYLRCQKPRRKRYASGQERRGTIRNRVSIDERPEIVEQKTRIGDWEGDTVIGKHPQGVLVALAERKSRDILAGQLQATHVQGVTEKINSLLCPHKHKCHTVTFDNGKEFAGHETIA
jgi:IS30 family transposase